MPLPRFVLTRAQFDLAGYVFGWQLNRGGLVLDCHQDFAADFDRDVEGAMDWAEQIIGTRQDWRHTRADGPERWLADDNPAAGTDVLRSIEPRTLLVAVGPGASGKSTFAAEAGLALVICLDSLREQIGGDAGNQAITPAAVVEQNLLLEKHLSEGTTLYLDSTNVEARVRTELVERARRHGRPVVALRFLPHLDTCRARNSARPPNRQVPSDVLAWQHSLALAATPKALVTEGFTAAHDIVTPL
ncbi:ATP-binding protein [Streptomyces ardesiacus]|uniref:ATP-binding protein n=1 Tax=Streptomyces ardesiacus TaxID=285564 RepID=UPI00201EA1C0|nr:ATP-binding protein [Streptomyces ardesiacus]MCL7370412.1 ATP-binding protein [Streptomyces ardesiacus]